MAKTRMTDFRENLEAETKRTLIVTSFATNTMESLIDVVADGISKEFGKEGRDDQDLVNAWKAAKFLLKEIQEFTENLSDRVFKFE